MMTRDKIIKQIDELKTENIELASMLADPIYGMANREIMAENTRNIELLTFAAENATDEDLRICQLALPGRASVMRWAIKRMAA